MSSASLDRRRAEARGIDYVERARELAPLLTAAADEIEERRELPERVVEALVEGGFFRLLLPRSLGGAELHPLTYVQVLEEIAKAEPSTGWCLGQNSGCSMSAPYLDPAVAREIFGPPRGILAWGPDLQLFLGVQVNENEDRLLLWNPSWPGPLVLPPKLVPYSASSYLAVLPAS